MPSYVTNSLLILLFILIGGVFAAAEMALVSLRESQLKQLSTRGKRGKRLADLAANPNRFLSAVQIGVTMSGFLSAAFGGATLAAELSPVLQGWGLNSAAADVVSLVLITVVISYFSIVLGELTAKRLAMQRAEQYAMALAPMVDFIARLTRPFIWFLGVSTNVAVRLFGGDPTASREEVTDEEIRALVIGSNSLGAEGRKIVDEIFDAGEKTLREVMVPRTEVDFMAGSTPAHTAIREAQRGAHSRYPVTGSSVDDILGFLHVRDLMGLDSASRAEPVSRLVRPVLSLPGTVKVLHALTEMRRSNSHLAIVRDEYGGTAGIVTLEDLVEELIGEIEDEYDVVSPPVRGAGTPEVDGLLTLEEFTDHTGYLLPEGPYDTVAGYWVARRGQLPHVGDWIQEALSRVSDAPEEQPHEVILTVTQLDGRRASRISVRPAEQALSRGPGAPAESGATDTSTAAVPNEEVAESSLPAASADEAGSNR